MNKLLAVTLLSLFPLSCHADVNVFHFNNKTSQIDSMIINGMNKISIFVVAGDYAWAVDYDHADVAFYDGKKWGKAVNVGGMSTIEDLLPSYPESGKTPTAWVDGMFRQDAKYPSGDDPYGNFYFDGKNWIKIQNLNNKTMLHATAGGHAWFTDFSNIYVGSDNDPQKLITIPYHLADYTFATSRPITTASDDNPQAFVFTSATNNANDMQLNSIDAFGINKLLISNFVLKPINNTHYDLSFHKNELLIGDLSDGENYWYSKDYGKTWSYLPNLINGINLGGIYDGKVCSYTEVNSPNSNSISCLDASSEFKKQITFDLRDIAISTGRVWHLRTPDAIWIISWNADNFTTIVSRLDLNTVKRIDSDLSSQLFAITGSIALSDNRLLICGIDRSQKTVVMYFDGSKWSSHQLSDDMMTKCTTNTSYTANTYSENGNAWFYIDEKYTGGDGGGVAKYLLMKRAERKKR